MNLEGRIPSAEELASILRLRRHVAAEYVKLLEKYHGAGESSPASASTQEGSQ